MILSFLIGLLIAQVLIYFFKDKGDTKHGQLCLIVALIAVIIVYTGGCFNPILYRSLFNNRRAEVGLQPYNAQWKHENQWGSFQHYNTNEKKQGLCHWCKQQWFKNSSLEFETDSWIYHEGDSINLKFEHTYYFNPNTTMAKKLSDSNHNFNYLYQTDSFLKSHGQSFRDSSTFLKALDYLIKREDSLQLNK